MAELPKDLIVFDAECVLCSRFLHLVHRHDRAGRFAFVAAQSELGRALYAQLGLKTRYWDTNIVYVDGTPHLRLDAFAMAMWRLGYPLRILSLCRYFPAFLKNPFYNLIARNRYRVFGRLERCTLPDARMRARFVQGGLPPELRS